MIKKHKILIAFELEYDPDELEIAKQEDCDNNYNEMKVEDFTLEDEALLLMFQTDRFDMFGVHVPSLTKKIVGISKTIDGFTFSKES